MTTTVIFWRNWERVVARLKDAKAVGKWVGDWTRDAPPPRTDLIVEAGDDDEAAVWEAINELIAEHCLSGPCPTDELVKQIETLL